MKLCRFGKNQIGLVDTGAGTLRDVSGVLKLLPAQRYPLPRGAKPRRPKSGESL